MTRPRTVTGGVAICALWTVADIAMVFDVAPPLTVLIGGALLGLITLYGRRRAWTTASRGVSAVPVGAVLMVALAVGACGPGNIETGGEAGREQVTTTSASPSTTQILAPTTTVAPVPVEPFIAGGSPGTADAVRLRAFGHFFDTAEITLRAGEINEVFFENDDFGDLHNLVIVSQNPSTVVFRGEEVTGITKGIYRVPALSPGVYSFLCEVHPINMVGIVKVV
jgi:plastocyanin